jgi:hypothetical protein
MIRQLLFLALSLSSLQMNAQTHVRITSASADSVMRGRYNPAQFAPAFPINYPPHIAQWIARQVSPDTLRANILKLASFQNRNTASDTLSGSRGIGAARRWIHGEFSRYARESNGRLLPAFQEFDFNVCNLMARHSNVIAVLPGTDTADRSIVLIEGHFDSRCEGNCDTACLAEGVEDNATGTALVMELARVFSRNGFAFPRTIVFMATTGEEQGLYGAQAFVNYALRSGVAIRAVINNDVSGGIICGKTASPPGCPGENLIDSIRVRLFSAGNINSPSKQLARFVKLQYAEMLRQHMDVPSDIQIMSPEDRTGRGGDHIPFRQNGFPAIRLTSAHEHGDADVSKPGYSDRQHSTRDRAGVDLNSDGMPDSFFVDFRYLARNTCINACGAAMAAAGPARPDLQVQVSGKTLFTTITRETTYTWYRIAVRSTSQDWDTVFTQHGVNGSFLMPEGRNYYISAAAVDSNGVESIFSRELTAQTTGVQSFGSNGETPDIELEQNHPNPFDLATWIVVRVNRMPRFRKAELQVSDAGGRVLRRWPVELRQGTNEYLYEHGEGMRGILHYSILLDGRPLQTRSMVFAN